MAHAKKGYKRQPKKTQAEKMAEFDVAVVIAQYCTFDTIAAIAALRFANYRVRVVLEGEEDADELLASDFAIDIRAYTVEEGSRIVKVWNWMGWDLNLPQFATLRKLVYDLSTNNGAIQDRKKPGGWLKDHTELPMSLVDFRQVWNLVQNLEDYSVRDHLMMIDTLAEAVTLTLSRTEIVHGRQVEELTFKALAPLFENRKGRLYNPQTPWMRAWAKKVDIEDGLPDDWWWCEHPLSICGFARQMVRAGWKVEKIREEIGYLISTMCIIAESSPSTRQAWSCIDRVFLFDNDRIGFVVRSDDTRIPARCWFASPPASAIDPDAIEIVKKRAKNDKQSGRVSASLIVIVDVREHVDNVAIMAEVGMRVEGLAQILQSVEPGRWDLVLKLTNEAGMVQPRVLNGGMSRRLVRTQIPEDNLVEFIQRTVYSGEPVPPPHFKQGKTKRRRSQGKRTMVDHTAGSDYNELLEIFRAMGSSVEEQEPAHAWERRR